MAGIGGEISAFFQAVLAGNLVYLAYTAIRVLRRIVPHSLFWISAEDILYWLAVGIYLFEEIFRTGNGVIRWYFVAGVLAGGYVTHLLVKNIRKTIAQKRKR